MRIPWRTFAEYLSDLRAGYRRQMVAGLRAREESGLRVRVVQDFAPYLERFFPLYQAVMERATHKLEHLNLAFFEELTCRMGPRLSAILVEAEDELVGVAVLLRSPKVMTFFMTGLDYSVNDRIPLYPILVTEVVAEAIRSGVDVLEMGQTSEGLKSRLGGKPDPRYVYFRFRNVVAHRLFEAAADRLFPPPDPPKRRVFRQRND